jgi:hypothetical protein
VSFDAIFLAVTSEDASGVVISIVFDSDFWAARASRPTFAGIR